MKAANDEGPRPSWWRRRILAPILAQLQQGMTPERVALTVAIGVTVGMFPIMGITTLLCGLVAAALKLNQPIVQMVNYVTSPLHIAMLLPFYRMGEKLFQQPPVPVVSLTALVKRFWDGPLQFLIDYGMVALYGIVVWILIAPLLLALVYFSLRPALQRMAQKFRPTAVTAGSKAA